MFPLQVVNRPNAALRSNIHGIDLKVPVLGGKKKPFIFFDNAASTPPLKTVLQQMDEFMKWYSGVHRGTGYKSLVSSRVYDHSHDVIAEFVGADPVLDTVVLVKNTTEAINKLSYRLGLKPGDIVLTTEMEHHSNDLPWRQQARVEYVQVDAQGRLNMEQLQNLLKKNYPRVKLVAVCGASNVTGHINDVHRIAELAHGFGARILVDGAQLIPHHCFNMKPHSHPQHIDFLAFSGHKIFAPYGCGALIGPRWLFEQGAPEYSGGGTVNMVFRDTVYWGSPPDRDEAGSPNVPGAYALAATLQYLKSLGMLQLSRNEQRLTSYLMEGLGRNREVILYGSTPRVGVVTFNIKGLSHALVGAILCFEAGIGVRTGCFCAQGYVRRLLEETENPDHLQYYMKRELHKLPGMVRVSLAAYNTEREIDVLLQLVEQICQNKKAYRDSYQWSEQLGTYVPKDLGVESLLEEIYQRVGF